MKSIALYYTQEARQIIRKLSPDIKPALRALIREIEKDPYQGKPLKGPLAPFRSARYNRYRVIYEYQVKARRLIIHYLGPRKNVYELFEALLQQS